MNNATAVKPKTTSALEINGFVLKSDSRVSTSTLNALHRCDNSDCNAAARVRAIKGTSELIFCVHHARKNVESLVSKDWLIDDQSAGI